MSERLCPRCHNPLTNENAGVLLYCNYCGAPQVLLSEELREQSAETAVANIAAQEHGAAAGNFAEAHLTSLDTGDPTAVDWTEAVRVAGLGGLIAFALGLLSMASQLMGFFCFFWALIAPIVVLGIYCARRKHTHIRAGFGARLGLVTGLTIAAAISVVSALQLIFDRFVFHHGAEIDSGMANIFMSIHQRQAASGQPMPYNDAIPEFRVGILLFSIGIGICLYLVYALISGAFGGFLRSRSRAA